jgi:hypothetical protein
LRSGLPQGIVHIEVWRFPATEPLGVKHCALTRIVVAHAVQSLSEAFLQGGVEIRSSREPAVILERRCPDRVQRALRHQALTANPAPERAADCAGICSAFEHRANGLRLARASVPMLAQVVFEAQGVVLSFEQAFPLEKMDREDRSVATVAAAQRQGAISKIGNRSRLFGSCLLSR